MTGLILMPQKDAGRIANSVDLDQTAPLKTPKTGFLITLHKMCR